MSYEVIPINFDGSVARGRKVAADLNRARSLAIRMVNTACYSHANIIEVKFIETVRGTKGEMRRMRRGNAD